MRQLRAGDCMRCRFPRKVGRKLIGALAAYLLSAVLYLVSRSGPTVQSRVGLELEW
jgi:hypothetical protein